MSISLITEIIFVFFKNINYWGGRGRMEHTLDNVTFHTDAFQLICNSFDEWASERCGTREKYSEAAEIVFRCC